MDQGIQFQLARHEGFAALCYTDTFYFVPKKCQFKKFKSLLCKLNCVQNLDFCPSGCELFAPDIAILHFDRVIKYKKIFERFAVSFLVFCLYLTFGHRTMGERGGWGKERGAW